MRQRTCQTCAIATAMASLAVPCFSQVHLTEFLALNDATLADEDGDFSDWIELHNASSAPVSLAGWTLTDDESEPLQWAFPDQVIAAGEYLIVFASDKNRVVPGAPLHTNFKLSGGGEYLALRRVDGVIATEFAPEYPAQQSDVSYGLQADLLTRSFFDPPTPGAANAGGSEILDSIEISEPHGFLSESIEVLLSHPRPGAAIHFSLDGREPTPADPIYTEPLQVTGTTILRARAFEAGFLPSPVAAATWIRPSEVVLQDLALATERGNPAEWIDRLGINWDLGGIRPGASYDMDATVIAPFASVELEEAFRALPTVSIQMHPDDLFGYNSPSGRLGIYPNSTEEGDDFERRCSLEWIDPDGEVDFTVTCGTNIQGGSSTGAEHRSQLSLALKFQSQYGPSKLEHQVFEDSSVDEFDYLVLDAGNQISINGNGSSYSKTHASEIRDMFMADLHGQMGHLSPHGRSVHVFLNGLYWGAYYLHERPDERFAAAYGPGGEDEYDWVRRGTVRAGNNGDVGTATPGLWKEVIDIVAGGVSPGQLWQGQDAYEALAQRVDLENYVDYMIANWYGGNTDWPQNNWMATAHARLSGDFADVNPEGRFRFHTWDAETVLYWGAAVTAVNDGFSDRTASSNSATGNAGFIHHAALEHPDYLALLADRVEQHVRTPGGAIYVEPGFDLTATPFDPAFPARNAAASRYYFLSADLAPAVLLEYARWGNYFHSPGQYTPLLWHAERQRLVEDYFPIRPSILLEQLRAATPQLFPTLSTPLPGLASGAHPLGVKIQVSHTEGVPVYYTLNGRDPRESLGAVSPEALVGTGSIALPRGVHEFVARAFDGSEWAPAVRRTYIVGYYVTINELQPSNDTTIADQSGDFEDWIELRNLTADPLQLGGFFLTDDPSDPHKFRIPDGVTIGPGAHLLFWADDDEDEGPHHTNFKLSAGGEYVGLYAPAILEGGVIDEVTFPAVPDDASYARLPDGRGPFDLEREPTPTTGN